MSPHGSRGGRTHVLKPDFAPVTAENDRPTARMRRVNFIHQAEHAHGLRRLMICLVLAQLYLDLPLVVLARGLWPDLLDAVELLSSAAVIA